MYPMVPRCIRIMTLFVSCPLPTIVTSSKSVVFLSSLTPTSSFEPAWLVDELAPATLVNYFLAKNRSQDLYLSLRKPLSCPLQQEAPPLPFWGAYCSR